MIIRETVSYTHLDVYKRQGVALDGTATLIQPLIDPLFSTKSVLETVQALFGDAGDAQETVKAHWMSKGLSDQRWRAALQDGVIPNTSSPAISVTPGAVAPLKSLEGSGDLEVLLRLDPTIFDGRFANNGWLQELPKPLTTLTWDNTVQVSPKLAEKMGVVSGDLVEVSTGAGKIAGGAWVLPGQAENCVTCLLYTSRCV